MPNLDVNLENYAETETLKLTPNGVQLLQCALRSFEDNDCEPWDYGLMRQLQTSLRLLKQPQ
jgi:hypothetical protein